LDTTAKYGRDIEKTVYLEDFKSPSNSLKELEDALNMFVKNGNITKAEKDDIMSKYKDNNVTDAQAYRSISSYRAQMDMSGAWTKEMSILYDKLKKMQSGDKTVKLTPEDYNIVWQPLKPFVYAQVPNIGLVQSDEDDIKKDYLLRTPV